MSGVFRSADRGGPLGRNQLGTGGIVFMVLAAAAPMAAVVVTVPLSIALGTGVGTPGAYFLAGVTLVVFAVGYVAMSRHVTNVGAFYAFVTRGLGRPLGLSTAMIALLAYNAMVIVFFVFFGVFANQIALAELSIDLPWQAWSAIAFVVIATLSYFRIHLSARVLGIALVCEFLVLLVLDFGIVLDQGLAAYPLDSFEPATVFAAAAGVSIMYAFSSFVGFEATAIYGEEARDPRRTVPRATYLAIAIIATFYAVTTWSLVAGYGPDQVVAAAGEDPAGFVFAANAQYVGGFTNEAMSLLICTSLLAGMLAFHNAAARYIFALSREGVLPAPLASTHPRFGSPYVASAAQLAVAATVLTACAVAGLDPVLEIGAAFLGLGTLSIIVLQALASFSVVGFFRGHPERTTWRTVVAPLLGGAALSTAAVLIVDNYAALTGAQSELINDLWLLVPVAALAGLLGAVSLRSLRPKVYGRFGERDPDELSPGMSQASQAVDDRLAAKATGPGR